MINGRFCNMCNWIGKSFLVRLFFIILVTLSVFSTSVSADYYSGTTSTGGHAKVIYSRSVATYGYTTIYDNAISRWNGISTKASVKKASASYTTDTYYVGTTSVADRTGLMQAMGPRGSVCLDCTWTYTLVYLYDNNMDKFEYTTTNRTATAVHEVGHSLKLDHTPSSGSSSIMKQGRKSSTYPTTYDKGQLKAKWGN